MKLILKPIKWLFYLLGLIIVTLLVMVGLTYKSVTPPKVETSDVSLKELLDENIATLVDETNEDKILNLPLSDEAINKTLKETLTNDNSTEEYIMSNGNLLIQGAWIDYKNELLNVNVGVHLNLRFMKFKTNVTLGVSLKLEETTLNLKVEKINLGNLGVKWLVKLAPKFINLEEMLASVIGDVGVFDAKNLGVKVNLEDLANKSENDTITAIIDLITSNNLVDVAYDEDSKALALKVNFKEVEDKAPGLTYNPKKFNTVEELNDHLMAKALNGLMSQSGTLLFDEKTLNHILYYQLLEGNINDLDYFKKLVAYENYDLVIGIPYFKLVGNKLSLVVPVDFGQGTDYFKSKVVIEALITKDNNDLVITLSNLRVGSLELGNELEMTILNLVTNNNGNKFVIVDFFDLLAHGQMTLNELKVTTAGLEISYTSIIGDNLLDDLFNSSDVPNEVKDILSDIKDNLTNDEDIESLVDDLIESINDLSDIDKNKIYDIINGIA